MLLFIKNKNADATGEYYPDKKTFIVKKGSKVSVDISRSEKFRGANTIERQRERYVKNGVVIVDTVFRSPSTAANFVTGRSTNGHITWKDENGVYLKELLNKE